MYPYPKEYTIHLKKIFPGLMAPVPLISGEDVKNNTISKKTWKNGMVI